MADATCDPNADKNQRITRFRRRAPDEWQRHGRRYETDQDHVGVRGRRSVVLRELPRHELDDGGECGVHQEKHDSPILTAAARAYDDKRPDEADADRKHLSE